MLTILMGCVPLDILKICDATHLKIFKILFSNISEPCKLK